MLQDKAKVSIGTFSTTSKSSNVTPTPQTEGWTTGPTPVAVTSASRTTIRNALLARPVPLQDVGYNVNFTNWDDALHMVNEASTTFDLVIFVTDGIRTSSCLRGTRWMPDSTLMEHRCRQPATTSEGGPRKHHVALDGGGDLQGQ